tara:strand:+ start:213 stop:428 length:216 start_codon:yes stop_codon:yes gene_type:complete
MYFADSLGLDFLAPQGVAGILILVTGLIFSVMMLYIWYVSIREMYPNKSQNLKVQNLKKQQEKIARLYPQS